MGMDINTLTIEAAHQGLAAKKFSSVELTQSCLSAIKKHGEKLGAFITVMEDEALKAAAKADERIKNNQAELLTGIPLAIKDAILIDDVKATGGSKILENYIATYDATVIKKLKTAGAVFIGKTNLDEFAMGSSTENSAFMKTRNPWDTERVPGGSSGGSAVAVAADMCIGALGSDTASSIRQPASFCGVVGLKATYGSVSRNGLMAMTSSLDQIGPLTKSVKDAAFLFQAISGKDKYDSTSTDVGTINLGNIDKGIKGMKIGIPKEFFIKGIDAGTEKAVREAIEQLEKMGAKFVDVSLPLAKYALAVYHLTATSEISTNLARFDGIRYGYSTQRDKKTAVDSLEEVYRSSKAYGFGSEVKRRIILGTFTLSAGYYDRYYIKAQKVRALIRKQFDDVFKKVDCLVGPVAPSVAFKLGEKIEDPLQMYLSDIFTVPANIGDICGISVPCGFDQDMPVGLQVMARPFDETTLFRVARAYELATDWHKQRPRLN